MAQVYLAMHESIGGFEKLVVFKRIMPWLCAKKDFVNMFLDEARLAAALNHPSIVEIFDIGRDGEGYYIVMEYLAGESVDYIQRKLAKRSAFMDPAFVCRIGASVAAGLDCAHHFSQRDGTVEPVVHRDVTPSNIIVCYSGVTKLVDFGIAKADFRTEETRGGGLKGKISYLAPEQVMEEAVDARTDVFQLGIVLWQLLTNRSLFGGKSDHERMLAVMQKEIPPPSCLNPACPAELDDIVLSALQRDRNARCPSADVLRRRLEGVIREGLHTVGNYEVGEWMKLVFSRRHTWRQQLEKQTLNALRSHKQNDGWVASSTVEGESRVVFASSVIEYTDEGSSVNLGRGSERLTPLGTAGSIRPPEFSPRGSVTDLEPEVAWLPKRGWIGPASVVALLIAGLGAWLVWSAMPAEQPVAARAAMPATYEVVIETVPEDASIELDGKWVARGRFETELSRDSEAHTLKVVAFGYRAHTMTISGPTKAKVRLKKEKPGPVVSSRPARPKPRSAVRKPRVKVKRSAPSTASQPPKSARPPAKSNADNDSWPRVLETDNLDPWSDGG